jgi:hypothetical protein
VIVRVSGAGQWRVPDERRSELNALDDEIVQAIESCDAAEFRERLDRLIDAATSGAERVPDDEIVPSDVILPGRETTLEEARSLFTGEGVIAGD